jgi:hypothetical protein
MDEVGGREGMCLREVDQAPIADALVAVLRINSSALAVGVLGEEELGRVSSASGDEAATLHCRAGLRCRD